VTAAASKIIWLVFGIAWSVLRLQPGRRARKTPVRYSGRGMREFALLGASLTGLGIVPCLYLATHFPRFADYPFVPVMSYLGIAVDGACLWLFHRTHRDLGQNWSVSLDLRERHTLVTTGVYARVRHPKSCCYPIGWLGLPVWSASASCSLGAWRAKRR
jgi:protein-S-isoprenylcysteine O-methyltransferase Ste14